MKKVLIGCALAVLLSACASKDGGKDVKVTDAATPPTASTSTPTTSGVPSTTVSGKEDPKNPNSILFKRVIYFEYNQDTVKSEFTELIQAHAKYLNDNRGRKIRLEGHADERGSREYNMALGQRRGEAVRRATTILGVGADRIETVSFGEDKPRSTGHDEAAWAQNRRVEIVYDGE
jgi:peptidoglycan-associated lipoprotein